MIFYYEYLKQAALVNILARFAAIFRNKSSVAMTPVAYNFWLKSNVLPFWTSYDKKYWLNFRKSLIIKIVYL